MMSRSIVQRKRKYPYRKKGYGHYVRKGFRAVGAVAKLARDVYYLKNLVNVERKYLDINNTVTPSQTPAFVLLNGMQQGTSAVTRLGQSIKMISIWLQVMAQINASASGTLVRFILFLDMQANAAAPAAGDILVSTSSVLSTIVVGNGDRFKILADIRIPLSTNGVQFTRRKKFIKCSHHVKYNNGNAGTIADIQTGSLYLLYMSDQTVNTPTGYYWSRIRFVDN